MVKKVIRDRLRINRKERKGVGDQCRCCWGVTPKNICRHNHIRTGIHLWQCAFMEFILLPHQVHGIKTQYPDTELTSPCQMPSYVATHIHFVSHCFDTAGIWTPTLPLGNPALYRFGHSVRWRLRVAWSDENNFFKMKIVIYILFYVPNLGIGALTRSLGQHYTE